MDPKCFRGWKFGVRDWGYVARDQWLVTRVPWLLTRDWDLGWGFKIGN